MNDQVRALIDSVRGDPEAREELLRALLPDRFLDLPARMDAIETALRDLLQAQLRTQAQLDALAQRVEELAEAQKRTEIAVQTLADRFAKQLPRIDTAIGYVVERRYAERASAYFASIASRIRVLSRDALDDLVDQALEDRTLTRSEANSIRLADTIASGRREGELVHLVVESSFTVDERDVDRAVTRAQRCSGASSGRPSRSSPASTSTSPPSSGPRAKAPTGSSTARSPARTGSSSPETSPVA